MRGRTHLACVIKFINHQMCHNETAIVISQSVIASVTLTSGLCESSDNGL